MSPAKMKMRAIPAPGPVPTSHPKTWAREPPGIITGSMSLSARGPATNIATGWEAWAMRALVEKTRPWSSGGTLDCQMAWLQPLVMGLMNMKKNAAVTQRGALRPRPIRTLPSRELETRPRRRP